MQIEIVEELRSLRRDSNFLDFLLSQFFLLISLYSLEYLISRKETKNVNRAKINGSSEIVFVCII